jgi:hypothetical protein
LSILSSRCMAVSDTLEGETIPPDAVSISLSSSEDLHKLCGRPRAGIWQQLLVALLQLWNPPGWPQTRVLVKSAKLPREPIQGQDFYHVRRRRGLVCTVSRLIAGMQVYVLCAGRLPGERLTHDAEGRAEHISDS